MLKSAMLALSAAALLSAGTITVDSINPLPPLSSYNQDVFGNPVGPYKLTTSIGNLSVTCLDLNLDTGPSNTPYTAYQTTTYSAANTTETQTYTPGKTKLYEQQAYLFSELIGTSNVTTQGYIQDAMWALADSAFLSKLNTDSISGPDRTQAQDALNYYNAVIAMSQSSLESALNQSDYTILSEVPGSGPSGSAQNQEFIYDSPGGGPTAPEPASLSLMGGALMALGLLSRRLRQAKK